jgi:hypothetical protein
MPQHHVSTLETSQEHIPLRPIREKWRLNDLLRNMRESVRRSNQPSLNLRFKEHKRYIRHNNPQSAYALHILQHLHEYGSMDQTMTFLKPATNTSVLTSYELFFIKSLGHTKKFSSPSNIPNVPSGLQTPNPLPDLTSWVNSSVQHTNLTALR